jgi:heme-degrading monooxygenase HmoA
MFARSVMVRLKPNVQNDFNNVMENSVLPILRRQAGFRDLIALINEDGTEATSISLWDNRESAQGYNNTTYKEVLSKVQNYIEGSPTVRVSNVIHSTVHKISTGKAA